MEHLLGKWKKTQARDGALRDEARSDFSAA